MNKIAKQIEFLHGFMSGLMEHEDMPKFKKDEPVISSYLESAMKAIDLAYKRSKNFGFARIVDRIIDNE